MKTVCEAASAIEPHMLLELLQQEGLEAQVRGEAPPAPATRPEASAR